MIREVNDIEEVHDFVKRLNYDEATASYPRIFGDEDLVRVLASSIKKENRNLVACYDDYDNLVGVSSYFWEKDCNFMQTTLFLAVNDYNRVADEMISHFRSHLPEHEYYIGFPKGNIEALTYFAETHNYACIEDSVATHIEDFKVYNLKYDSNLMQIKRENFTEYADFHDPIAKDFGIFYDAENLLKQIDEFCILALKDKNKFVASIFLKPNAEVTTVYGIFLDDQFKSKGIEDLLIDGMLDYLSNAYDHIEAIIYFIDQVDQDQLASAYKMGFEKKEDYCCYLVKNE